MKKAGVALFTLFLVFTAYKILTPPVTNVITATSPDGSKTARLLKIYYVSQPSYKIFCRNTGSRQWLPLLYLSAYTNVPHQSAVESLEWSPDSQKLFFQINGTVIWHYDFTRHTGRNRLN